MTSAACVPIDPVEPTRLTVVMSVQLQILSEVVRGRQDEEEAVEAVEHPAVAGEDRAHVLDADVALDERLGQVAEGGDAPDDQAEKGGVLEVPPGGDARRDEPGHDEGGGEPA